MTEDAATWGANVLGKAWALNEKVEAARPHAKAEANFIFAVVIFAIVTFPVMSPWRRAMLDIVPVETGCPVKTGGHSRPPAR